MGTLRWHGLTFQYVRFALLSTYRMRTGLDLAYFRGETRQPNASTVINN